MPDATARTRQPQKGSKRHKTRSPLELVVASGSRKVGIYERYNKVLGRGGLGVVQLATFDPDAFPFGKLLTVKQGLKSTSVDERVAEAMAAANAHSKYTTEKILSHLRKLGVGFPYDEPRYVALKTLVNQGGSENAATIDRFRNEALLLMGLNHPNVVSVLDYFEYDDKDEYGQPRHVQAYVMEYLDIVRTSEIHAKCAIEDKVRIMIQACKALEYLHDNGLIHRDIKPDNLPLVRQKDATGKTRFIVKVTDLGLAKDTSLELSLSMSQGIMGTPYYAAPEQLVSTKHVDYTADVYSLGATLFHLVCGVAPYDGITDIYKIVTLKQKPDRPQLRHPSEVCPDVAPELEHIIEKSMEFAPADRYQSMAELRDRLEKYLAGERSDILQSQSYANLNEAARTDIAQRREKFRPSSVRRRAPSTRKRKAPSKAVAQPDATPPSWLATKKGKLTLAGGVAALVLLAVVLGFALRGTPEPVPEDSERINLVAEVRRALEADNYDRAIALVDAAPLSDLSADARREAESLAGAARQAQKWHQSAQDLQAKVDALRKTFDAARARALLKDSRALVAQYDALPATVRAPGARATWTQRTQELEHSLAVHAREQQQAKLLADLDRLGQNMGKDSAEPDALAAQLKSMEQSIAQVDWADAEQRRQQALNKAEELNERLLALRVKSNPALAAIGREMAALRVQWEKSFAEAADRRPLKPLQEKFAALDERLQAVQNAESMAAPLREDLRQLSSRMARDLCGKPLLRLALRSARAAANELSLHGLSWEEGRGLVGEGGAQLPLHDAEAVWLRFAGDLELNAGQLRIFLEGGKLLVTEDNVVRHQLSWPGGGETTPLYLQLRPSTHLRLRQHIFPVNPAGAERLVLRLKGRLSDVAMYKLNQ